MRAELPPDESRRLELLRRWDVLDSPPERTFDELTRLAAALTGCPIALVSLVDADRQWFKSVVGLDVTETPRDHSFCAHAILRPDEFLVIPDARADERMRDNPLVTGAPHIRFYAGAPLVAEDPDAGIGPTAIGTLCVIDRVPHELSAEQLSQLKLLGRLVASELRLRARNRELAAARDEALAATRAKSEFLASMSHEIRTPLTSIVGFAELLTRDVLPEAERVPALETIHRAGQHLMSLVDDVLDLSKIEAGKMSLSNAPCDLAAEVAEAARVVEPAARGKGLELRVDTSAVTGVVGSLDALRFRQVLVNLLGNAVKFTSQGHVAITAALDRPAGPDFPALVTLTVVDTGIGMNAEVRARLFRPFTQADQSATRRFGGTGLGLSISYKLAEMMGGTLSAESENGRGSKFTVTLPVPLLDASTPTQSRRPGNAGAGSVTRFEPRNMTAARTESPAGVRVGTSAPTANAPSGPRVLVAEDGEDNRRLFAAYLGKHVSGLTMVEDGNAALRALREQGPFDVVLMDMHMPDLDGLEATRRLRAAGLTLPVLALTASATPEDRQKCLQAGCDDFLTKPITRQDLLTAVKHWAKRPSPDVRERDTVAP